MLERLAIEDESNSNSFFCFILSLIQPSDEPIDVPPSDEPIDVPPSDEPIDVPPSDEPIKRRLILILIGQ
jgi:hypothetical protein